MPIARVMSAKEVAQAYAVPEPMLGGDRTRTVWRYWPVPTYSQWTGYASRYARRLGDGYAELLPTVIPARPAWARSAARRVRLR